MSISCNTDLDINRDPDAPLDVPLRSQLPAGIAGLIAVEGSSYALIGGFWSQYWSQNTSSNQYRDVDSYIIGAGDYYNAWRDMYDALGDIREVKRKALAQSNWNYYLIATVLEAQGSQLLTDAYGDVPFTEANNKNILQPKYDNSISIYDKLIINIDDALSRDLSTSKGEIPANDDLIFGGDTSKWTAYANTLKLKIFLRQINSSRSALATTGITSLLSSGVSFLTEDAGMTQFTDAPNLSNPLYESDKRNLNFTRNLKKSSTMSIFLATNSDARATKYYGTGNALRQGDFGNATVTEASLANVTLDATTPSYLMTKEESLFILAEAYARVGNLSDAKTNYDNAVLHNFSRYTLVGSSFVASGGSYEFPTSGTFEDQLKKIIEQKWVSNFPGNGFESFLEAKRTKYPAENIILSNDPLYVPGTLAYSIAGATGGIFPKRLVYPQEETNTNTNTPLASDNKITKPQWWHK